MSQLYANRFNADKIDLSLLPVKACEEEAKVWMMGEKKYGRYNWQKLWGDKTTGVAMASLLRHAFAILDGEVTDKESGLYHAAHIRCNAAMLIEHYRRQAEQLPDNVRPNADGTYTVEETTPGYDSGAFTTTYSKITKEQLDDRIKNGRLVK